MARFFIPDCFVGDERAQTALCASAALAQQEHDWSALLRGVSDLGPKLDMEAERAKLLKSCNAANDPGACLADAFRNSSEALNRRKTKWKAEVTEPGDPNNAKRAVEQVVGTYQHTFGNADVQGDEYRSTDTLEIKRASEISIHYDAREVKSRRDLHSSSALRIVRGSASAVYGLWP